MNLSIKIFAQIDPFKKFNGAFTISPISANLYLRFRKGPSMPTAVQEERQELSHCTWAWYVVFLHPVHL